MVCSCGDICKCKELCTCQIACCPCLVCHKMDLCKHCHSPLCNVTLTGSDNEKKCCQCLHSENKVARKHARRSHPTAACQTTTANAKPKDFESGKELIFNLVSKSYSLTNEGESLISKCKEKESSAQGEPRKSRFGSLKLKMRRMSSRFRKQKHTKNSHVAVIDQRNETSNESSVETDLSDDTAYSPSKMTEAVKDEMNYASVSVLQPSPKLKKHSFTSTQVYRNLEETATTKSFASSSRGKTDIHIARQCDELAGTTANGKQSKGNQSSLPSKSPSSSSQFSLPPLHIKLSFLSLKSTEKLKSSNSSNENHGFKSPEDRKSSISNLKDSKIFSNANTHRPIFFIGDSIRPKSTSDVDRSRTIPSVSQEELPSSQSCSSYFDVRSFRTRLDEEKISELLNVSGEILSLTQSVTSNTTFNSNSIKSPLSEESSKSSTSHELTYSSCSLPREPLLPYHSDSSSSHSIPLTTPPGSLLELPLLERGSLNNSNFEGQNISHAATLFFVSDLSGDFEALDIRSSPYSTDSESVSSSEFLSCSYCRFISYAPLMNDSVIPYEPLE